MCAHKMTKHLWPMQRCAALQSNCATQCCYTLFSLVSPYYQHNAAFTRLQSILLPQLRGKVQWNEHNE